MENTNLYKIVVLVLVVIGFALIMRTPNQNELFNQEIKIIEKDEYKGIVVDKFIDQENHNTPTIVLLSKKKVSLYGQQWGLIDVGDSLSKKINSTVIEVFKKNKLIKIDQKEYIEHLKRKNK